MRIAAAIALLAGVVGVAMWAGLAGGARLEAAALPEVVAPLPQIASVRWTADPEQGEADRDQIAACARSLPEGLPDDLCAVNDALVELGVLRAVTGGASAPATRLDAGALAFVFEEPVSTAGVDRFVEALDRTIAATREVSAATGGGAGAFTVDRSGGRDVEGLGGAGRLRVFTYAGNNDTNAVWRRGNVLFVAALTEHACDRAGTTCAEAPRTVGDEVVAWAREIDALATAASS